MMENSTYSRGTMQRKQMHYSPNLLNVLTNCIDYRNVVVIEYESLEKGISHREVEAVAVVYKDGKRSLVGWCRLRNEYRSFRLDRVNSAKWKSEKFNERTDFNINDFQDDPSAVYHEEEMEH